MCIRDRRNSVFDGRCCGGSRSVRGGVRFQGTSGRSCGESLSLIHIFMRTKLKAVVNGYVLERRFNIGEKLEDVRVERRPHQYLYMEGADYIFMNQETFDQIPIAHDLINGVDFLLEGMVVDVVSDASTETVLFADVPVKVQMKITYTEPGLKGDTATNTLKPATVESGATVRVPLFINEGETIEIDTRDGSYVCLLYTSNQYRELLKRILMRAFSYSIIMA